MQYLKPFMNAEQCLESIQDRSSMDVDIYIMISKKNHFKPILSLPYMMSRVSRAEQDITGQNKTESHAILGRWGPAAEPETGQRCIYEYTTNLQIVQSLRTPQTVDRTERVVKAQWSSPKVMDVRKQDSTYTKPTKIGGFTH